MSKTNTLVMKPNDSVITATKIYQEQMCQLLSSGKVCNTVVGRYFKKFVRIRKN